MAYLNGIVGEKPWKLTSIVLTAAYIIPLLFHTSFSCFRQIMYLLYMLQALSQGYFFLVYQITFLVQRMGHIQRNDNQTHIMTEIAFIYM